MDGESCGVLLLHSGLQHGIGHEVKLWCDAAIEVAERVGAQVGQEQLAAPVQQVKHILRQRLHAAVAHLLKVKDVLQEVQHLILSGDTRRKGF